jgi:hypothetical protein
VLVSSSADFDLPFVGPLVSEGQVHAYGVDAVAAGSAGSRGRVTANYSYWHVSQLGLDKVGRPDEHELRHQARVELMYSPARPRPSTSGAEQSLRGCGSSSDS